MLTSKSYTRESMWDSHILLKGMKVDKPVWNCLALCTEAVTSYEWPTLHKRTMYTWPKYMYTRFHHFSQQSQLQTIHTQTSQSNMEKIDRKDICKYIQTTK